jgi:hypothetical protein
VLLAVTVVVQLVVLYAPRAPATPSSLPWLDKLVHLTVFGAVAWAAVRCGLAPRVVGVVLVAHAALSEIVQHTLLAHRTGDVLDAVADSVGVVVGLALGGALRGRRRSAEGVRGA